MVRVVIQRPLEERGPLTANAVKSSTLPSPTPLFSLEEDRQEPRMQNAPWGEQAPNWVQASFTEYVTAASFLLPLTPEDESLYSAVLMARQASGGNLELIAQILARLGYSVKLATSGGGSIYRLKHTYLTATRTTSSGNTAEWVIDPTFASNFAVASPTPRYAHILSALPPVLVAPLPRLVRALLLLGAELARCFEEQCIPLPPWRNVEAIASKYDAVNFVAVHGSVDAATAAAAGVQGKAAPQVAAAAAARKQQRDREQLENVQLRLARLGLLPQREPQRESQRGAAGSQASSCSTSPCGSNHGLLGESPPSVLAASRGMLGSAAAGRVVGFAAQFESSPSQRQPKNPQASRQQTGLLGWRLRRRDVAASAA